MVRKSFDVMDHVADAFRLGCCCVALLWAMTQGEFEERTFELWGRMYRISTERMPLRLKIEPADN